MLAAERLKRESDAVDNLLQISDNKDYERFKQKLWDEELVQAWWSDLPPIREMQKNQSIHEICSKNQIKSRPSVKFKDQKRSAKLGIGEIKFFHFKDTKEYMAHYRESITLPGVMEYRKKLLSLSTDRLSLCLKCAQNYSPHDLVKHCHCIKSEMKPNGINSSSVCYGIDSPQRSPSSRGSPNANLAASSAYFFERKISSSGNSRTLCWKNSNSSRSSERNIRSKQSCKSSYDRFCSSMPLQNKDINEMQKRKSCSEKSPNTNQIHFFTNSKLSIGPRMGSNYPPSKEKHNNSRSQNSNLLNKLRPKLPQAAIPVKGRSFQACILPMSYHTQDKNYFNSHYFPVLFLLNST